MSKEIEIYFNRLDQLTAETVPRWGTMTAQKMVEHLINTFKISNGQITTKCYSEESKLPVLKKILMSDRPMPKGFDSPANREVPITYQFENLLSAKNELRKEIDHYYEVFEQNPDVKFINPTFGELNKEEWDHFHKKHLTHHLSQFGLL